MDHSRRIAIVLEDSVDAAEVLQMYLQDIGYATEHLVDPMELGGSRCRDADLLLLDLALGRTDGVAVMRQHRDLLAGLPILLVSAHSTQVQAAAVRIGRELGLDVRGYLPKPFARSLFQSAVASALSAPVQTEQAAEEALPDPEALLEEQTLHIGFVPRHGLHGGELLGFEARYLLHGDPLRPLPLARLLARAQTGSPRARLHDRIVTTVLDEIAVWNRHRPMHGWIPLPADRLTDTRLADQILRSCEQSGVAPGQLRLLLAEEELACRFDALIGPLARIAMKGIELALEDFGAGLSILSRLHCIPCVELRLAPALTDAVLQSGRSESLVGKCVELAHELDREVSVRGLTTESQIDRLRLMGCDHGDGSPLGVPFLERDSARALAAHPGGPTEARAAGYGSTP